jgi:hypothetical protein
MHHRKYHDRLLSHRDLHRFHVMPLSPSLVLTQQATRRRLALKGLLRTFVVALFCLDMLLAIPASASGPIQTIADFEVAVEGAVLQQAFDCGDVTDVPIVECEALVALYNSTNGPNWSGGASWLASVDLCHWSGVQCTDGHVTALHLCCRDLRGFLPVELGNLTYLQWLVLHSNNIGGSIPAGIGNITSLLYLDLGGNRFWGTNIPPELGSLENVTFVQSAPNWAKTGQNHKV